MSVEYEGHILAGAAAAGDATRIVETMLDSPRLLVALMDTQFNFLRVSRAYAEADGRELNFFPGRNHFELYPNDENEALFRRVVSTGKPVSVEAKPFEYVEHPERGVSHWDWSLQPIKNDDGTVRSVLLILVDVSDNICAIEALTESESHYRRLVETTNAVPWEADAATLRFTYVGPQAERLLGYPVEAWYEDGFWFDHLHEEDRDRAVQLCREHTRCGQDHDFEYRMVAADGTVVWVRDSVQVAGDGPDDRRLHGLMFDVTERRRAEEALRASERELSKILDSMQDTFYRTDRDGRLALVSASVPQLLGYSPEELIGTRLADLYVEPDGRDRFLKALADNGGAVLNYEAPLRHKDGSVVWVLTNSQYYRDDDGEIAGVEGMSRNITDRRQAEARMRMLSGVLEQTADTVMVTDHSGSIEYVNPAFEQITGYSAEAAVGRPASLLKSGRHDAAFYRRLWTTILGGKVFQEVFVNRRRDGSLYYEEKTITPLKDEGGAITHFVSTGKDITERMQAQERLHYLAHHDVLTELPNRVLFFDRLAHALDRCRAPNRSVAVLFLDLDRFKIINDTLGHDVGDRALLDLAQRLTGCVRRGDTIARLGGDEFAVILEDLSSPERVSAVADKIMAALGPPIDVDGRELFISASIGVSMYPGDGSDPQTLLKHADIAMYRAKEQGRNTYRFYSADMSARAFERLSLETSLRHALERDEFELHYQPQVDLRSGSVVGVEALLRWRHPDLGMVSPLDFIPVLEETSLILPVGEWVVRTACRQVQRWREGGTGPLRLAVNLSSRQFNAPGLPELMADVLHETGIDPLALELEITESTLVQPGDETEDTFQALADLDLRVAIDDFGTGYSSLSYLKRFSIDTLKIDRAFIADVTSDPDDAAIVQAVIAMARQLNIQVVAEGVETEAQLEFLRAQKCDLVQGFLFSRPLPADQLAPLLRQTQPVRN